MPFFGSDWNDDFDDDSPIGISSSMKEYIRDYYCTENNTMSNVSKYRVWDGEKKAYAHEGYVVTQLGLVGTYDSFVGLVRDINCTVEQCTGVTDKNGKLIYEGDVLNFDNSVHPVYVQWDSDKCRFVLQRFDVKGWETSLTRDIASIYNLVGNIHEMETDSNIYFRGRE